jgi:hypothetical protein
MSRNLLNESRVEFSNVSLLYISMVKFRSKLVRINLIPSYAPEFDNLLILCI